MITKGEICVILQQVSDNQNGQVNLDSRIMQERIADKILAKLNHETDEPELGVLASHTTDDQKITAISSGRPGYGIVVYELVSEGGYDIFCEYKPLDEIFSTDDQ